MIIYKTMFEILKKLFASFFNNSCDTGCNVDTRPQEEKDKDWYHEEAHPEVADSASIYLVEKPEGTPYIVEDQGATNTCVPHGVTLALGIRFQKVKGFFVRLSKAFIYRLRSNMPSKGMWLQNAFELVRTLGVCVYSSLPTPFNERMCNDVVITSELFDEAKIFKSNYFMVKNANNIDTLAGIAYGGDAIAITIFATRAEWSQEYVKVIKPNLVWDDADVQHCITVLPKMSFIENGIKYITIQDSSWFGKKYLRRLPEDFIKLRLTGAGYPTELEFKNGSGMHPVHVFDLNKPLSIGMQNSEVKALQVALQFMGYFPADKDCTGYYGGLTRAAVRAFQDRFAEEILGPAGLTAPTGYAGKNTLNQLNNLYGR